MKVRIKKFMSMMLVAGLLVTSSAVPTLAASANVSGGIWSYGTSVVGLNQKRVYSNYYHASKTHKSSASIGTRTSTSGWTSAGVTSYASAVGKWGDETHTYYNTK